MNVWEKAREEYRTAEVPPELAERVQAGIAEGKRRAARNRVWLRSVGAAAACFAVLLLGLNLSPAFASAAGELPVVGGMFRVLTVRSYHDANTDRSLTVNEPALAGGDAFTETINREIRDRVEEETARGEETVREYKEAFLSTGGTEEQWAEHDNRVTVTYEIKSQTDSTVSFVVSAQTSTSVGYQEDTYYNLDIAGDRELTLRDLLGDDWVRLCNESIRKQMADSADPSVYFDASMGGFTTVDESTDFYINAAGNPVVVFPRATVAIGAMGAVEFEIAR